MTTLGEPRLIKRREYVAMRRARAQTKAYRLFEQVSLAKLSELPEEGPQAQALMQVWQRFTEDIVRTFAPLACGTGKQAPSDSES